MPQSPRGEIRSMDDDNTTRSSRARAQTADTSQALTAAYAFEAGDQAVISWWFSGQGKQSGAAVDLTLTSVSSLRDG
jgi:hypothetical protein